MFFFRKIPSKKRLKKYYIDDYYWDDIELSLRFRQLWLNFSGLSIYFYTPGCYRVKNNKFIVDGNDDTWVELLPEDYLYSITFREEGWIGITLKNQERFISTLEKLWFYDIEFHLFLIPSEYWNTANKLISSYKIFDSSKLIMKLAEHGVEPIFSRGHDGQFIELLLNYENPIREILFRSIISVPQTGRLDVFHFGDYLLKDSEKISISFTQIMSFFPSGLALYVYNLDNSLIINNHTLIDASEKTYVNIFPEDIVYSSRLEGKGWIGFIIKDAYNFLTALKRLWFNNLDLDLFLVPVEYWSKVNNIITEDGIANIKELVSKLKEEVEPIFIRGFYGMYVELLISPQNYLKEKILKCVLDSY